MPITPQEPLLSVKEAARLLELSRCRVAQLISEGRLAALPKDVINERLIPLSEITRYSRVRRPYRRKQK